MLKYCIVGFVFILNTKRKMLYALIRMQVADDNLNIAFVLFFVLLMVEGLDLNVLANFAYLHILTQTISFKILYSQYRIFV